MLVQHADVAARRHDRRRRDSTTTATTTGGSDAAVRRCIRDQLPDALADGITAAGGLGLAHELYLADEAGAGK